MKPHYKKQSKQFPFKSRSRTWHAASASKDNLVISFSEDDSESEYEDLRPEGNGQRKDDIVAAKVLQKSTSTTDLQTVLSHNSLDNKMKGAQGRVSTNSLLSSSQNVVQSVSAVVKVPLENVAQFDKHESKRHEVSGLPRNQVEDLKQEILVQESELKAQDIASHKKRIMTSFPGDARGPGQRNSGLTVPNRYGLGDRIGLVDDEQEAKRLKLGKNSHVKLIADVGQGEAKGQVSLIDACILGNARTTHQLLPQQDTKHDLRHRVDDGTISLPAKVVTNRGNIEGSDYQIGESSTMFLQNGNICSWQGEHQTSGAGMSLSHNHLNVRVTQVASGGLIPGIQKLTSHVDDAFAKQSKINSESLVGATDTNQLTLPDFPGYDFTDFASLMKLEEINDKELEEAQDIRHKCEMAERHALRAYREAQRALIEANERCSLLYRRREMFSSHLRTLFMDGADSLLSPGWQSRARTQFDSIERASKANDIPLASEDCGLVNKSPTLIVRRNQSEANCGDDACNAEYGYHHHIKSSNQLLLGHSSRSEVCYDSSVLGPDSKYDGAPVGGTHSPTLHNMSIKDNGGNLLLYTESNESRLASEDENLEEKMELVDFIPEKISTFEKTQDFELEATLRSQLCARFSKKPSVLDRGSALAAAIDYKVDANRFAGRETDISKNGQKYLTDALLSKDNNTSAPLGDRHWFGDRKLLPQEMKNDSTIEERCKEDPPSDSLVPLSILGTVVSHLKPLLREPSVNHGKELNVHSSNQLAPVKDGVVWGNMPRMILTDSYHCDFAIDPFLPLCMFDLRGRCNDQECKWQHLRDCRRVMQNHNVTAASDALGGPTIQHVPKLSDGLNGSTVFIPTYRIGSNLIKAERFPCGSFFANSNWHYWQMSFCSSFLLPFSIHRYMPSDAPLLNGCIGHTDDNDLKRHLLSSIGQDELQLTSHGLIDIEQVLELAIDLFSAKTNKILGRKKALSVLSRSLEAIPNSPVLWIIYLNIYYKKEKDLGGDDMFLLAVNHNKNSYDLWLMYINSRMQFNSRMDAYDEALHALCHIAPTNDMNKKYLSACILDVLLQMFNFLCMSGNAEMATSKIYGLLDLSKDSEISTSMLIETLSCLVPLDRCILWICCIFLAVYQRLPQVIVEQFECEKVVPFDIDWPVVNLGKSEKHPAMELFRMALDNMDITFDDVSCSSNDVCRTMEQLAHFVAVSHVRFAAATEGLQSSIHLLEKYIVKYPTCIELIKLSAHSHQQLKCNSGFECFEQAFHDWPKGTPGVQCLWNQYIEYALECNREDIQEELMIRWFSRFCNFQVPESRKDMGEISCNKVDHPPGSTGNCDSGFSNSVDLPSLVLESEGFCCNQDDVMFGFLNLFIYEVMQKDMVKAHMAIDRALKEATIYYFEHCVREHSSFYSMGSVASTDGISIDHFLTLLHRYLGDVRNLPRSQLSRRFQQHLKKPRLRHLIDSLLGPVSSDCSLLNHVLEECYGASLIPEKLIKMKDLVDYVEHLIEIYPSNYKLAISACKHASEMPEIAGSGAFGTMYWAATIVVSSILQSSPVAPEHAWVEAANLLSNLGIHKVSEIFLQLGLSVYPFSKKLWQSYYLLSKTIDGNTSHVIESAREKGIELT